MTQSRKSRRNNEVYRSLRKEERLHAKERQSRPAHQSEEGAPRIQDEAGTRAEETLRQAEQKFRAIFDNTSDGIFLLDLEARRFTLCNTSCLQMLGYTREEFVRLSIADLHSPEDLPFIYAQMEEFLNGRKGTRRDIRFRRKDGSFLFVDLSPYLVRLDGRRYVVVTLKDITERKRMEEALAASERKYRSLVENIPDVTWTTDRQGRTRFVSPNVADVYGYSAEEVCAEDDTWLGNVHPDDRARVERAFEELFTKKKRYDVEYRIRRKDGTWIWLHDRSVATYEKDGRWYADGVFSEITERKRMEEELRQHTEHLEELVTARTGELRENEARYRSLYHTVADGIFVMGAEGQIEDANDSACAQLGYTREELTGMPVSAVSARPDFNLGEIVDRLRAAGSLSYETAHRRKDGLTVPVELSLALVEYRGRPAILGVARDITERKRAETALRESRQRLQAVVEGTSDAVYLKDLQGRYLLFNSAAGRFVGKRPDEVLGRDDTFLFPPDEAIAVMEGDRRVMGGGKPVTYEEHVTTADGQGRTFSSTKGPILDADGRVVGLFGIARDITESKRAGEALRESEEQYRRLVENLKGSHFIYRHDTTGMLTYVSESVTQVLGYTPEEGMPHYGKYFTDHPANQAAHRHTELTLQGIRQPSYEVNVWHKDGSSRWLEVQEVPVYDADGKVVAVEGVAQDITERKQAQEALRESEAKFRLLAETSPAAIFIHQDGRFVYVNPAAESIAGYRRDELAKISPLDAVHPDYRAMVQNQVAQRLQGISLQSRYEAKIVTKDGRERWMDNSSALIMYENKPAGLVVAFDITERKRAEEELRELNATLETRVAQRTAELQHRARQLQKLTLELSQAEDRERQRIAGILHEDVQQMLAAAKFHLNLLDGEPRTAEESREIVGQVKHMLRDAIEKARHLSHELSPALYQVGLIEILNWLARHMQQERGLTVRVEAHGPVDSSSEPLKAFLYKVAQELLFNVVKHAEVTEARIRVRRRGSWLYLSVVDQGRGFDPRELEGAVGFGLLSIRERIQLLGGRMKIRSTPGRGSRILLAVPDQEISGVPMS
jgi:PAS domain S-box-containing protein